MRLLVFGETGQVARELARRLPEGATATFLTRAEANLSEPESCAAHIEAAKVDAVINAAAYTAVDKAESDEATAIMVNGTAPGVMAEACATRALPFLHLSTDYVFDGSGTAPFAADAPTCPLGVYGRSKLLGEERVRASVANALILRTSWVVSAHGANFVKTMLGLAAKRDRLNVVADQVGGPTPAAAIADALFAVARAMVGGQQGGTYHFAGEPDVSWAAFAREIMSRASLACEIAEIPSSDYPTPAKRPANSRLDCASFTRDFAIPRPDWRAGLDQILTDLGARS